MQIERPKTRIGPRVRELRLQRRLTQAQLAKMLAISQGYLSELERGRGSFTAEQFLAILGYFNVPADYFAPQAASGAQLQNTLARLGARHLTENEQVVPSDRLKSAQAAIREALVSADSARQIAAIAPVLVDQAGRINFVRLHNEFMELRLERRLGWLLHSVLEALDRENSQVLPRGQRLKYRRATTIIAAFFTPWRLSPEPAGPPSPPQYDVLDPEIATPETLQEVIENLSPIARKWKIATTIEIDDFVRALRAARGAD